jgi:putative aminopeptidase FrvX
MRVRLAAVTIFLNLVFISGAIAQTASPVRADLISDLQNLVSKPAVPGYESQLTTWIADRLKPYAPKTDALGSVTVTIGQGQPSRLIVAPIDEPGYVVSRITDDGYLQLQRLPQFGALPLFNELHTGQPVEIMTNKGQWLNGAVAGLSVHLQPGRKQSPDMNDVTNLYVDIGASSAAEVRQAGIDLLSPVALDRTLHQLANGRMTATSVGDRFGAAALLQLLADVSTSQATGSVTIAFVTQQWVGGRGLARLINQLKPEELIFVGRTTPTATSPAPTATYGDSGVLIASDDTGNDLGKQLLALASKAEIKVTPQPSTPLIPSRYVTTSLPARTVRLSVPILWPATPAETINGNDVHQLRSLLRSYVSSKDATGAGLVPRGHIKTPNVFAPRGKPTIQETLSTLIESYGVSEHEAAVTNQIKALLPSWAKTTVDKTGNLVLDWGNPQSAPEIVFVAHQDELGYVVKSVLPDGRLELDDKGGGLLAYFLGHPIVFHTENASLTSGVLELPPDWQKPDFKWPADRDTKFTGYVGASNPEEVAKLGIKVGDTATVLKKFRPLLNQRASARSFDDRVGCTALIAAAWALGPNLGSRRITFVWSTGEEIGLVGAAAYAQQLATEGKVPKYVFAVDTFVSSDSPLESKRFGYGLVGSGFVIRAIDNSNLAPHPDVLRLIDLMKSQKVPVQYGITGGGNDGAAFVPLGTIDVAMGWPLRYSHSPAEVIDLRDVDSLARGVEAVARNW